jgi:secretion/DNA translocation related TadE-like protein
VRAERGSITVVTAAVIGLALVVSMGVADVARVLVARAHAQAAADSAALAAAQELALASGRLPSQLAGEYAALDGATMRACICEPGTLQAIVTVEVSVTGLLLFPGRRSVSATARAVVDLSYSNPAARGSRLTGAR